MADILIKDLPTIPNNLISDDLFQPVDTGSKTYKVTVRNLNNNATTSAQQYAQIATTKAAEAATSAASASGYADQAYAAIQNMGEYVSQSAQNAAAAANSAENALAQKQGAQAFKEEAATSATDAGNSATLSQSWAEGNTGARPDESVHNSMFWAEKARYYADVIVPSVMIENNRLYYVAFQGSFLVQNNRLYVKFD